MSIKKRLALYCAVLAAGSAPQWLQAQETSAPRGGAAALLEEVVVVATKKKVEEKVQDVPAAMSAFGEAQLDALKVRDISSLSYSTPNTSLEDIGTAKGTANFSVRGLGVNSSIPSIDPAVGVFVDGMYYGVNSGVIFDTFDLESVEILRGPQGVLFGRNVTGGAVILNTKDASFDQLTTVKAAIEGGGAAPNYILQGTTTGTLIDNVLAGKLALYYNDDKGWFENIQTDGSKEDFGKNKTKIVRTGLTWLPSEVAEVIFKYEYGDFDGDGPAAQSHTNGSGVDGQIVNFDRNSYDFSISDGTFGRAEWHNVIIETNVDVELGDGQITNIIGFRDLSNEAFSDIDATPQRLFHADVATEQDQFSNEFRYNGQFNNVNLTTGVFFFQQDLTYSEVRFVLQDILPSIPLVTPPGLPGAVLFERPGGGVLDQTTLGAFATIDVDVTEQFTLTAGLRYSDEEKKAKVASVSAARQLALGNPVGNACRVTDGNCIFGFEDTFKTDNVSPKVGFNYSLDDYNRIYGSWTKSFRAGGYNFRSTGDPAINPPGPFKDEEVSSVELGWKLQPSEKSKVNIAVFQTRIDNMQREINFADPVAGVTQIIRNTADALITGIEIDTQLAVTDQLILTGSIGMLDGEYEKVLDDLNNDGNIDALDEALEIPRLAKLTYNAGILYDTVAGSFRLNYNYRDRAAYTDDNLGYLNEVDRVDASYTYYLENGTTFSLFGKNLTDDVTHGNDTQLPANLGGVPVGGTFAPLNKGRVFGIEVSAEI